MRSLLSIHKPCEKRVNHTTKIWPALLLLCCNFLFIGSITRMKVLTHFDAANQGQLYADLYRRLAEKG